MLDLKDKMILKMLQNDASISVADLAENLNLTVSPCWKRLKRLEDENYITKRVALLNPQKLGLTFTAFVNIKTKDHSHEWFLNFVEIMTDYSEVVDFYRVAGEYDYIIKVIVKDIADFDRFYKKLVNSIDGLTDVTSYFAMEILKSTTQLPIC